MNIREMVKDKKVQFSYYRDGALWYTTECGFLFPVDISDIGTATFQSSDKAILFMRYIRYQLALVDEAKSASKNPTNN